MREQPVQMNHAVLDAARLARGWTWADLGRAVGLSPPTRQKVANGGAVSIRTVRRIARVLRVSVRSLLAPGDTATCASECGTPHGDRVEDGLRVLAGGRERVQRES